MAATGYADLRAHPGASARSGGARNDCWCERPHVSFTIYDEVTLALRRVDGLYLKTSLQAQQMVTRALGIWGVYLMATATGAGVWPALLVAAICSLGALVSGPRC